MRQIKASPIRLKIRDISYSAKFTKTLFVRFKSNRALQKLVVDLARAKGSRPKVLRDPHISLLYKKISTATKKEIASTIKLPFREVAFDSIKAVRCRVPVEAYSDIKAWRVIATKRLR